MDAVLIGGASATEPKKNGRGNYVSNYNHNNHYENFDTCAGSMSFSYMQQGQPPLLPLPHGSSRSLRSRDTCLTEKKCKARKQEEAKKISGTKSIVIMASDNRWGPQPKDLPKVIRNNNIVIHHHHHHDVVSGFIFNLAPPPSSLPLPKFFMRSKLSCNSEAAAAGGGGGGGGVDDGATNNLRRLLRLR